MMRGQRSRILLTLIDCLPNLAALPLTEHSAHGLLVLLDVDLTRRVERVLLLKISIN